MNMWLKRRHGSCPACRSVLNNNTLHRVDFGPTTSSAEDEQTVDGGPVLKTNIQYHAYDPRQFGEFECQGQYGEKVGPTLLNVGGCTNILHSRFKHLSGICVG